MRTAIAAAASVALLLAASFVYADTPQALLKQAKAADDNGDIAAAEKLYLQAAKTGDAESEYELGSFYSDLAASNLVGGSDPKTVKYYVDRTMPWLTKAALQGHVEAEVELGQDYANPLFGKPDLTSSYRWTLAAAQAGDAQSQCDLGKLLEKGTGVSQDKDAALSWYRKSAAQGNEDGQMEAARLESELKTPP